MSKCEFNKVAKQLRHVCSPVKLLHIFRTPLRKNTYGMLLLVMHLSVREDCGSQRLLLIEIQYLESRLVFRSLPNINSGTFLQK